MQKYLNWNNLFSTDEHERRPGGGVSVEPQHVFGH